MFQFQTKNNRQRETKFNANVKKYIVIGIVSTVEKEFLFYFSSFKCNCNYISAV